MSVLSAPARLNKVPESGVRPFDVGRDLRAVAELIAEAFAHELDDRGSSALREMRVMSHFSGFIKLLNHSTGEFDDYFGGFVWVEDGKVVGNVTVQRAERNGGRWQIANVAVAKNYRGHGIARRLMDRAMEHVASEGGKNVVLQVYEQNQIARTLYEHMGFEEMGGTVDLQLSNTKLSNTKLNNTKLNNTKSPQYHVESASELPRIPNFYSFSNQHWQPLYELVNNQLGEQSRWWRTIRRTDFQLTFEQLASEWFWQTVGRQHIYRRCVQGISQRFEAALILTAIHWRGMHKLQFWARPDRYGQYEEPMLRWVLWALQSYPRWPLQVTLSKGHQAALDLFQAYGFTCRRTLLTMRKEIT